MKFLGWSWLLGRVRGVDVRFHFSMLFSLPIAYMLFKPADLLGAVEALLWVGGLTLFILLHEAGHALAAQAVGVEVRSIVLWLLGGFTNLARKPEKPSHNLFVYAAGPLVNMLLAFLCVVFYILTAALFLPFSNDPAAFIWLQTLRQLSFSLAVLNIILVVFNLVPVYPLDGGNILHALSEWLFGRTYADRITIIVGIPFLLLLVLMGLFTRDYILLFFCVLMAISIGSLNHAVLKNINLGLAYVFKRAGYYYLQGDFERAAQLYTVEIDKQPNDLNNYMTRAGCYLSIGQKERALADVERALRLNRDHPFALELRGELYMFEKNFDAALEIFNRTKELNPNWAVPYFDIASLQMERGELQPALENFNKSIALQPRMPLFHIVRSLAHFKLGDLKAAHADQDTAVGISPEDAMVMVDVNLMVYEENLDWARDYYGRILDKNPRHALALQGLADACLVNQSFRDAVTFYIRALEANPKASRLYLGRGKAYLALNEAEKAKADFERVPLNTDKLHLKRQAEDLLKNLSAS